MSLFLGLMETVDSLTTRETTYISLSLEFDRSRVREREREREKKEMQHVGSIVNPRMDRDCFSGKRLVSVLSLSLSGLLLLVDTS